MAEGDDAMETQRRPGTRLAGTFHSRLRATWRRWELEHDRRLLPEEVASWLVDHGYDVTPGHVRRLRSQSDVQPSLRLIEGLADFFDIDSGLLLTADRSREELASSIEHSGVAGIAMRATGLTAANLEAICALMDQLRTSQNLPPVEPER